MSVWCRLLSLSPSAFRPIRHTSESLPSLGEASCHEMKLIVPTEHLSMRERDECRTSIFTLANNSLEIIREPGQARRCIQLSDVRYCIKYLQLLFFLLRLSAMRDDKFDQIFRIEKKTILIASYNQLKHQYL